MTDENAFLNRIYNLVLDRDVRDWERVQLFDAKHDLESGKSEKTVSAELEAVLRPLAIRSNLSPKLTEFYSQLTGATSYGQLEKMQKREAKQQLTGIENTERAVFAGGCFWCTVEPFDSKPGVLSVISGFTGGVLKNPTYDQVSAGGTGHHEAVEILFDPTILSYSDLLDFYWQLINPTDAGGQYLDRGERYQAAIFVDNDAQHTTAESSKAQLTASGNYDAEIVTPIRQLTDFWPAEDYHQDWYKYNPKRYRAMEKARERYYKKRFWQK